MRLVGTRRMEFEWNSKNMKAQTRTWVPAQAREMWMTDPAAIGPMARTDYDLFAISTTKDWFRAR